MVSVLVLSGVDRGFDPGRHDIAEIMLKVALNTKNQKSKNHSKKP
jgi:hypothetical protein